MVKSVWFATVLLALIPAAVSATEVGLVTAVSGNVKWQEAGAVASELKPFVKVREGDQVLMETASRLQVVYFESGRQETWQGAGTLEVGNDSSKVVKGGLQPEIRTLPAILVRQLAKTPSPDGSVKTGMVRMRSLVPIDRLESVEREYAEMRRQADASDRNPELYLLASYFELREFDKLEALLGRMNAKSPAATDLTALNVLYYRAISAARSAGK